MKIERIEINNGTEIRGLPSGRRTVEVMRGTKWAKVRLAGHKTFRRVSREALDRITLFVAGK